MTTPEPTVPTIELAPGYAISRLIRGGWQLAGGHGPVEVERAIADMAAFVDAGVLTFDCADIYTGVEELIGRFRRELAARRGSAALAGVKVHTKFVPDRTVLAGVDRAYVQRIIDRSLQRLGTERLDLVQFHWWDYGVPGWLETAGWLGELQAAGKIHLLGGTNFDTAHTAALLQSGMPLVSMQVQYSLLDPRPEHRLVELCARTGMQLLCYGALAGGFLTEPWLGRPDPGDLTNRSLVKYRLVIEEFGGWDLFQTLLQVLRRVADRHGVNIANVATRWVLDRPQVAAVILGARYADHLPQNLATCGLTLDTDDLAAIATVLRQRKGPTGDVFELERDPAGRHARVMKYDLNDA